VKRNLIGLLFLWLCTNALAIEKTIIVSWSEVVEDSAGNPINEPLEYELYADIGFGFNKVTTTPDLQYVHIADVRPGCFQVYVKACYAGGGICSPSSSVEEACVTVDGDSGNDGGSSGSDSGTGGATGSAAGIPPRAPVFTISIQ